MARAKPQPGIWTVYDKSHDRQLGTYGATSAAGAIAQHIEGLAATAASFRRSFRPAARDWLAESYTATFLRPYGG